MLSSPRGCLAAKERNRRCFIPCADGSIAFDFTGRLGFSWPLTAMPVTFDAAGQVAGALFARGAVSTILTRECCAVS